MTFSDDAFVVFFMAIAAYYVFLFLVSKRNPRHRITHSGNWGFVVLIPGHNEAAVIADTVERARALPVAAHVVVIDDGSTDGTGDIVRKRTGGRMHLLQRVPP